MIYPTNNWNLTNTEGTYNKLRFSQHYMVISPTYCDLPSTHAALCSTIDLTYPRNMTIQAAHLLWICPAPSDMVRNHPQTLNSPKQKWHHWNMAKVGLLIFPCWICWLMLATIIEICWNHWSQCWGISSEIRNMCSSGYTHGILPKRRFSSGKIIWCVGLLVYLWTIDMPSISGATAPVFSHLYILSIISCIYIL